MNPASVLTAWLQLLSVLALEAAVIVSSAALLQRATSSAVWRRTIWQVCVSSLIALTVFELTGAARNFASWAAAGIRAGNQKTFQENTRLTVNQRSTDEATPVPRGGVALPTVSDTEKREREVGFAPLPLHATPRVSPNLPTSVRSLATPTERQDTQAIFWTALLWVLGSFAMLGRVFCARFLFALFRQRRQAMDEPAFQERVQRLARQMGIKRQVRLITSRSFSGPFAFGVMRHNVGLPFDFTRNFKPAQQEVMLAHELAHLAARDPAWYLLAHLAAAMLWWHPLVWWARRQLHVASEAAADEASLLVANGPELLAECLVELGSRMTKPRALGWLGIDGNGFRSGLGRRVERLVLLRGDSWQPPGSRRTVLARTFGPLLLVTVAILCIAWTVPQLTTKGHDMKTSSWKGSLAGIALMSALALEQNPALAADPVPAPPQKSPAKERPATLPIPGVTPDKKGTLNLQTKLERIILPEVAYDSLPLGEVVKHLIEESAKLDPEKRGVNFLFARSPEAPNVNAIDPATGLPFAAHAIEPIDLQSVTVRIVPPLKHVRLLDVLDAITRAADHPINYSIEEYAVVFSIVPTALAPAASVQNQSVDVGPLEVLTFKIGTTNFFADAEKTFGVAVNAQPASKMQNDLRQLLVRLAINMDNSNKAVFFNERTGVLMVRATWADLAIVQAAIETLGGAPAPTEASAGRGGFGGSRGGGIGGVSGGVGGGGFGGFSGSGAPRAGSRSESPHPEKPTKP